MLSSEHVLKVLSIDASAVDIELIQNTLKDAGHLFILEKVTTTEELRDALLHGTWSFVISEYEFCQMSAIELMHMVQEKATHLPFILLGHGIGEESVADMMKGGAYDYVSKAKPERLIQVVKRILNDDVVALRAARTRDFAHKAYAAKEQMLAIVSHDIKNPLSAIQLEAQMLLRVATRHGKSILGEEVKIQAGRILKTTDRLKMLITDLLDRNKTENNLSYLTKEEVDIGKLFQEVLDSTRPLVQEKGLIIRSTLPLRLLTHLDKNKMFQVLINLVTNAIKFTPPRGSISVMIDEHEHELICSVRDSGPGLNMNDLHKVFEKYWTGEITGCSGTGLGLFICKTIVEAHGGNIFVENHPEGGAIFSFTLPKPAGVEFLSLIWKT